MSGLQMALLERNMPWSSVPPATQVLFTARKVPVVKLPSIRAVQLFLTSLFESLSPEPVPRRSNEPGSKLAVLLAQLLLQ